MLPEPEHAVSCVVMTPRRRLGAFFVLLLGGACIPAYIDTIAPKDAKFEVECSTGCGRAGREKAVLVNVSFLGSHERQLTLCCPERAAVLAQLKTVRDFWCDGLDVPEKTIGDLRVGTTLSEGTGKRGARIDQGEGYVSFQCDGWLPQLIEKLENVTCCGSL
jgi:hypothetical protein